jgi:hypothetical protein
VQNMPQDDVLIEDTSEMTDGQLADFLAELE